MKIPLYICYIDPSLLMVILLARNAKAQPRLFSPQQSPQTLGPLGSYYDGRMHFSKNHHGTWRNKMCYLQVLDSTWHAVGSEGRSQVEREGDRENGRMKRRRKREDWGSAFSRVHWWGTGGSCVHSSFADWKHKSRKVTQVF